MDVQVIDFFRGFYAISDDGSAHEEYAAQYTEDAKLIMGNKTAVGRTDILELRKGLWSEVSRRKHTYRLYSSAESPGTYLLEGNVQYAFKSGKEETVKWMAKADLKIEGGGPKLDFYQVVLNVGSK